MQKEWTFSIFNYSQISITILPDIKWTNIWRRKVDERENNIYICFFIYINKCQLETTNISLIFRSFVNVESNYKRKRDYTLKKWKCDYRLTKLLKRREIFVVLNTLCVCFLSIYIYIYIIYIYIYYIYIWIFSKLINKSINFTLIRELTTEDSLHIGLSYYIYILPIISFGDCYSVIASVLRFAFFFYSDLMRLSNGFDYLIFVNFAFYFQGQIRFRSFIQALLKYVCVTWQ